MLLIQPSTAGITIPSNSCDQARGQNAAAACFYPNLATQNKQSQANMLGAPLKQVVTETVEVPEEMVRDWGPEKVIGDVLNSLGRRATGSLTRALGRTGRQNVVRGQGPPPPDTARILQTTTSKRRTPIYTNTLGEYTTEYQVNLFDSLNYVLSYRSLEALGVPG